MKDTDKLMYGDTSKHSFGTTHGDARVKASEDIVKLEESLHKVHALLGEKEKKDVEAIAKLKAKQLVHQGFIDDHMLAHTRNARGLSKFSFAITANFRSSHGG